MSVTLLILFAIAMLTVVVGKVSVAAAGVANIVFLFLLATFVVLSRIQGIRKPVV